MLLNGPGQSRPKTRDPHSHSQRTDFKPRSQPSLDLRIGPRTMTRSQRIYLFSIFAGALTVVYFLSESEIDFSTDVGILIYSTLLMISFTALFVEHFFATPTDVISSSIAVLIGISPIHKSLSGMGAWYWILFAYSAAMGILALSSMLLFRSDHSASQLRNRISASLKRLSTRLGSGRAQFFVLFIFTAFFYVDNQSRAFILLLAYSAIVILVDPKRLTLNSISDLRNPVESVGEIIGVQSRNLFIANLYRNRPSISVYDYVAFRYGSANDSAIHKAIVIDKYMLDQEQWIKVLEFQELTEALEHITPNLPRTSNVICKLDVTEAPEAMSRFVGFIVEGSRIGKIRFEYGSTAPIEDGDILVVKNRDQQVLYQIVQGLTEAETLERKNESSAIIGEAVQLGIWNSDTQSFSKYGWVPEINSAVFQVRHPSPKPEAPADHLGFLPGTPYSVGISLDDVISHHLAILGITGSGKSVLARHLIRRMAEQDVKIICVDFTNEYRDKFPDLTPQPIIPGQDSEQLFQAIDALAFELSKFKNQQHAQTIEGFETQLSNGFGNAIQQFLESDRSVCLFELPDISNTTGILEYTKWFFRTIFRIAREHGNYGQRLCIVLEEAHTVVPEFNFLGVSERQASALVNNISQIALQGRKYDIGFIIIAQRTANVSKTVLTQCNSVLAFRQFDKTGIDFLSNYMGTEMASALPDLKQFQAVAVGKAFRSGVPLIVQIPDLVEPEAEPKVGPAADQELGSEQD